VLQFASYNFDVSIVDIVDTLIHGGCLCIPSESDRKNDVARAMNLMQVTWADLTPSFAMTFGPDDVPTLRTLVLAGEDVQREHIARWAGKVQLINCYGPAESSACTAYEYRSISQQPGVIGYPMPHANCWVANPEDDQMLVSDEAVGELLVESPALARGYLNDHEKTEAVFIRDPLFLGSPEPYCGRRVYKTGDLVSCQSDGTFKFIGRKDNQVKIRGQRVELGEVESQLLIDPAIQRCVAVYPKSGPYAGRLVAAVQLNVGSSSREDDEVRFLSIEALENLGFNPWKSQNPSWRTLPAYMIPTAWIVVERIPLTPSKKIDRRKIVLWLESSMSHDHFSDFDSFGRRDRSRLRPEESIAWRVSSIVADICARDKFRLPSRDIGYDFSLASMGVDSILAIFLSRYIQQEFNTSIYVDRLTGRDTTVRSLAADIEIAMTGSSVMRRPSAIDIPEEVANLWHSRFTESTLECISPTPFVVSVSNVFLTGATGFLGVQILRQLLLCSSIKLVILHVRASSPAAGLQRIIKAAQDAGWSIDSFKSRIEIWPGDLAKPHLGLAPQQWKRLTGAARSSRCMDNIDGIIHNGGAVRWNVEYASLKAANVLSTLDLLIATVSSPFACVSRPRLTYISGGQRLSFSAETNSALIEQVSGSNGYSQSKLVSELLVKRFACNFLGTCPNNTHQLHGLSVIKPSYIMGPPTTGRANTTDYLWRLAVGALEIEAFPVSDYQDGWLFVDDAESVAAKIVESIIEAPDSRCTAASGSITTKILSGISTSDFWAILASETERTLQSLAPKAFFTRLRQHVEAAGPSHPLWPLSYMLDEQTGGIGSAMPNGEVIIQGQTQRNSEGLRVKEALRCNIRRLTDTGYLGSSTPFTSSGSPSCSAEP
jgi:thioester reductase-like protein